MIISSIVATDLNNGIGKQNQLLWSMPGDLKFFKTTTLGHPVIMGRKTYESMDRLLPGRKNIIITRNIDYKVEGAEVYNNIEDGIKACEGGVEKIFIIGGAEIFKQSFHLLDEMFRTVIKSTFDADTFIPEIDKNMFKMTWEECHKSDEKNKFDYCFQKWERIK